MHGFRCLFAPARLEVTTSQPRAQRDQQKSPTTQFRPGKEVHGGVGVLLELLQDQLLLPVVVKLVGAEELAVVERRQVVDVDLSRLVEEEDRRQWLD